VKHQRFPRPIWGEGANPHEPTLIFSPLPPLEGEEARLTLGGQAQGSLSELDTQLELAKRLGYLAEEAWTKFDGHLDRIDKMLSGLIRHQRRHKALGGKRDPSRLTPDA
jgi:hypothetical protein